MEFFMKDIGFFSELPYGRLDISGNEEYGFRPYQLMAASIAVCSGGVLRTVLQKMRLEVEDIHINADVVRNEQEAGRIEIINVHFRIKGKGLEESQVAKAVKLARKNCSMVQSVTGSITVEETFEIIKGD